MEINDPNGDRKSEWFVTTGLLVAEMVSGKQQIGDKEYKRLAAAEIAVGGDGLETDPGCANLHFLPPCCIVDRAGRIAHLTVQGRSSPRPLTAQERWRITPHWGYIQAKAGGVQRRVGT